MKKLVLAKLLVAVAVLVLAGTPSAQAQISAVSKSSPNPASGLSGLPANAQGAISAALGKNDPGYWVRPRAAGWHAENPRHALVAHFTRQGAEVRSDNLGWQIETRALGYGSDLRPLKPASPQASANRVEYRREGVTEWYENGPLGLEQGFTLAHRPRKASAKDDRQPLTLDLLLGGDLLAKLDGQNPTLELTDRNGKVSLRYTGLEARDANGQELQSWMELRGEHLLLRVQDAGARYPVVVDPWVQQAELTASDGKAGDELGTTIAVSGGTVVVGAMNHQVGSNAKQGAAYVFVQNGTTWTQQAELTAADGKASDYFGASVAISGSTAVVGAWGHTVGSNANQGAAYVFAPSGTTWSQQAELTASDGEAGDAFGLSVALDGTTAIVGSAGHTVGSNSGQGAAYVFAESGGTWTQQAELTAADGATDDYFGTAVALSGTTAVVGDNKKTVGSNQYQGSAYVFVNSAGTWSQQAELTSSDGAADDYFGYSVAVSGGTALIGAWGHSAQKGTAYVFAQSGASWSQQAELTASDGYYGDFFGTSVWVSDSTAMVGAPGHTVGSNIGQGAVYAFVQSGTSWPQQAELTASDGATNDKLGEAVAVSGSTLAAGAWQHAVGANSAQGAAYVFTSSPPTFITLASFDYTDGAYPTAFIQGANGDFYGATDKGGPSSTICTVSCGTIFEITPTGTLTTVGTFNGTDGNGPSGLVESTSGLFYGTTSYGGTHNCISYGSSGACGTVFQMTGGGAVTTLYDFCAQNNCTDGAIPWGGLALGSDGNYYGTTSAGGTGTCSSSAGPGCGTIFKITTAGALTTLHSFVGTDGAYPYSTLVLGSDGNFYGTTFGGGTKGYGTVFKITTGGTLTTLHNFVATDGAYPLAGLIQAKNGNFYGTASAGLYGSGGPNCTSSGVGDGTVFEMTTAGTLTTVHTFAGPDGSFPYSGVIQGADGNFYGMTSCGGTDGDGTIFQLTPTGSFNTLHTFVGTDGSFPFAGMVQASSGTFYGTTVQGGADNYGTVFSLSLGSPATTVTLSPTSLSFGDQLIDTTSSAKTVTLTNSGTATLDISSISITAGSSFFAISSNTCEATLAAGKKCKVSVKFTPTALGAVTGTLSFTDNASGSPQTVSLSGTGEAQATLTPASYTFKKTQVGKTSAAYKFTLKNNLSTTLTGISYSTAAPFAVSASTCGTTLDSKKSCTISLTFSPASEETFTGTLTVTDSANDSPQTSSLSGTGD